MIKILFSVLFFSTVAMANPIYNIENHGSQMCLSFEVATRKVIQTTNCSSPEAKWELVWQGGYYYNIKSMQNGFCLNSVNGTNKIMIASTCNTYQSHWSLGSLANGKFNILSRYGNLCLSIANNGLGEGDEVIRTSACGQSSSQWSFPIN